VVFTAIVKLSSYKACVSEPSFLCKSRGKKEKRKEGILQHKL
jgi:hypothetical protein